MTHIYLVAGETSGDIHGANLVRALRDEDPSIECGGVGGRLMAEAGMRLDFNLAEHAIMGFAEVVRHLRFIRALFNDTVARLERERPQCLVAVDYPGFNIRLAREAKRIGIPVVWYISPQVWAWKRGRVKTLAQLVRKMLVILPFEESIYREAGVDCEYVGHPLVDHLAGIPITGQYRDALTIGLLPGSREQEIGRLLGVMIGVARGIRDRYPHARFVVPCVDADREAQVRAMAGDFPLETAVGKSYEVLGGARFCLVASGTATVEAALLGVPMIVLYKVAPVTYALARMLVHVEHIGMVNILAGKRIAPEFIQGAATVGAILPEALALIEDGPSRTKMIEGLSMVRERIGGPGASRRAALAVLSVAREASHG